MKKKINSIALTVIVSILLFSFSGCSKAKDIVDNATSSYYVKFKIDGTEIKYTYTAGSINGAMTGGGYSSGSGGQKDEFVSDKNTLTVLMSTANPVVVNTIYTNYTTSAAGQLKATLCTIGWFDANGNFFGSWGDEFASTGVVSDTKIKFTEINSSSLKGTFSGTAYKAISGTAAKHLITDGEFFVQR